MGCACSTGSKGSDSGPVRIRLHRSPELRSAPKHLRNAQCISRFPLGHHRFPHTRAVERVPTRYPPVDQPARWPDGSDDIATGSSHLPLLSQVLSRGGSRQCQLTINVTIARADRSCRAICSGSCEHVRANSQGSRTHINLFVERIPCHFFANPFRKNYFLSLFG